MQEALRTTRQPERDTGHREPPVVQEDIPDRRGKAEDRTHSQAQPFYHVL